MTAIDPHYCHIERPGPVPVFRCQSCGLWTALPPSPAEPEEASQ